VALVAAAVVGGCRAFLPSNPGDHVQIRNDTTTDVAVHVNGAWVGTVAAGQHVDVPLGGHGGPPFRIEAKSRSGAVLFEMAISADDYQAVNEGRSAMGSGVAPGCGWIEVRYGKVDPADATAQVEAPVGVQAPGGVCP
jgi:hypothetical protein